MFVQKSCTKIISLSVVAVALVDSCRHLSTTLVLPESLHCLSQKHIIVGKVGIDMNLLTRKNLTHYVDISHFTLFWHAKDVGASIKTGYIICKPDNTPYSEWA